MKTTRLLLGNTSSLEQELKTSPVLSDIFESVQLVSGGITSLFINKSLFSVGSKSIQTQDFYTRIKKQIIYKSQALDGDKVLEVITSLTKREIEEVGQEFLCVTARKFAKCQPIEKYSTFLRHMFNSFGFNTQFLKCFLNTERDSSEVQFFLVYISKWDLDQETLKDYLHQSTMYYLEKFCIHGKFDDFFDLFEHSSQFLSPDFKEETLSILFTHFITFLFQKEASQDILKKGILLFQKQGLKIDISQIQKILENLGKNLKGEEYLNYTLKFVETQGLVLDLLCYNMIMDYYCSTDKFNQAKEIFDSLLVKEIQPDSFSYSILIKGLKSQEQIAEQAFNLFSQYKSSQNSQEIVVYNSLLDLLISQGEIEKANQIFTDLQNSDILKPDEITFNTVIKGCCKIKDLQNAMIFFKKMKNFDLKPNRITYNSLMDLAVKIEQMVVALELVEEMQNDNISPDSYTYSIILNGLKINNSSENLVRLCLQNIKKVIIADEFKQDTILFNSILDVASKYNLIDIVEDFYNIMKKRGIRDSTNTCTYLIQAYTSVNRYQQAIQIFKRMIDNEMKIKESSYGLVLECCTKNGRMDLVMDIYYSLKDHFFNENSIVFTTIIKGYMKQKEYQIALQFFEKIKNLKELPGIIITYNCALDIYANIPDIEGALSLFEEIQNNFEADLISYSTIIKALCHCDRKVQAMDYLKKMIKSKIKIDVSVINLFLESCSTKEDFKLAIDGYKFAMMQGIEPNEITFGIMVKVFGFSRELEKAFDLLDLMQVYKIAPSIIIFTNLIHISFYNREPRKAELAFSLFRKQKLDGDALLYSKIIDGLIRFRQIQKVPKYIKFCFQEKCSLNEKTISNILKYFKSEEMLQTIEQIRSFSMLKKKPHKNVHKFVNTYNLENPKKYKQQIREQRVQIQNSNINKEQKDESKTGFYQSKQPKTMALHNFRRNRV